MILESFANIYADDRIGEILIYDDASDEAQYYQLLNEVQGLKKVRLIRGEKNVGCYCAKAKAIAHSETEYVIIFDSDNTLDTTYLDAIYAQEWRPDTILQPEFARPAFDFTQFAGKTITRENVAGMYVKGQFDCLINAMNYFVHRDSYLAVWEDCPEPYAADTILQNYNWLRSGRKMLVTPGMQYFHRLHPGSHFLAHEQLSRELHKQIIEKVKELR